MAVLRASDGGVLVACRAVPRSSRSKVAGLLGEELKVAVTAAPVDGRANAAVCAVVADFFGVPKRAVSVKSGDASRSKVLLVFGLDMEKAAERLANIG